MMDDFNLIISTPRRLETEACSEIWFLLGEIGDQESTVRKTHISGLIVAKTVLDEFTVIEKLRNLMREKPQEFQYTLRIIPINLVVRTKLGNIVAASLKLSSKILKNETFRVTVEKRHTNLSNRDVVYAVAECIDRKVDLDDPDKTILVEILGGISGVSVIKPEQVLSFSKEKLAISE